MRKLLIIVALLAAVGVAGVVIGYFYIDSLVVAKLGRSPTESHRAAIYAEPVRFGGQKTTESILRERLVARSYREVTLAPNHPGEYRFENGKAAVFIRQYNRGDGTVAAANNVKLTLASGEVRNLKGEIISDAALEPLVIAELGAGAIKATQYRPLAQIPRIVQDAVISVEDERFYSHFGIDIFGLLRATWQNLKAGRLVQGGSTLTQQYIKNTLFSPRRTIGRKIREFWPLFPSKFTSAKKKFLSAI